MLLHILKTIDWCHRCLCWINKSQFILNKLNYHSSIKFRFELKKQQQNKLTKSKMKKKTMENKKDLRPH